jgi:uncharacterized protein YndB with AHSA1/START domain
MPIEWQPPILHEHPKYRRNTMPQAAERQMTRSPVAKTAMLIRSPVATVFEAFIDPAITSQFWFTKGSGTLEPGKKIRWEWEMYGASTEVDVKEISPNRRILVEWAAYGVPTAVEWLFTPLGEDSTFVEIANSGFSGTGDEMAEQAISSTEGFTFVLSGLKALLEHNVALNLIGDRFPKGLEIS